MTVKTRLLLLLALVGMVVLAVSCTGDTPASSGAGTSTLPVVSLHGVDNKGAGPEAGMRAPNFVMTNADGSISSLSDLRGQPVVLNFWATWCPPCRAEMPDLVKAYETHKDSGLVIVGINEQDEEAKALAFMDQYGIEFPVILDSRGDLASLYAARGLPATFFIDRNGNVVETWSGMLTPDILEERLQRLLEG